MALMFGLFSSAMAQSPPSASPPSAEWQATLQLFDQWAAVQQTYPPEHVAQMRQQLLDQARTLPAAAASALRETMDAKLHVLLSTEARDARKWLAETLAVAAPAYAKQVRAKIPDYMTESPAQIQAQLDAFEAREANQRQVSTALQKTREMQIKNIEEAERRQAEANLQATAGGYYNPAYPAGGYGYYGKPYSYGRYVSPYGPPLGWVGLGLRGY
jgi:hypothetical protein